MGTTSRPSVALAHDYLTQRGGAERVALRLAEALHVTELVTTIYEASRTFDGFRRQRVRTSSLDRVLSFRRDPRLALPLLSGAVDRLRPSDADVLVTSTSGWAHGVRHRGPKIAYCHNPARWLYQPEDYLHGAGQRARMVLGATRRRLREWDREAAGSVDLYLANSTSVAARIRAAYGVEARVVHPPYGVDPDGVQEPVPDLAPGFWLTVARGRGYKNTRVVCEAVEARPGERLVVVGGLPERPGGWSERITSVGRVTDAQLRWLYARARALVSVSREDFGLTPVEAYAFGTPAVVLRAGGFLDSTQEGVSGVFVEEAHVDALHAALDGLPDLDPGPIRAHSRRFSPAAFAVELERAVDDVTALDPRVTPSRRVVDLVAAEAQLQYAVPR